MNKKNTAYLFLDFDGVLCDSAAECYASSWIGYHRCKGRYPDSVSIADKEHFYRIRPYIRDAEDYLVLHYAVEHGIPLEDQQAFDTLAGKIGEKTLNSYHEQFFIGRSKLYEEHREYWLSLHPMFPVMRPFLESFARCDRVHILSTKAPGFISIILKYYNLPWPEERIHYSKGREKLSLLGTFLDGAELKNGGSACFIEDQIDNVIRNKDRRITPRLASWGYLRDDWRRQTAVPLISEAEFRGIAESVLAE